MAIVLLEKYHAYAPPFKWVSPKDSSIVTIGGLVERVPWTQELETQLKDAWNHDLEKPVRTWMIPSRTTAGVVYEVKKLDAGYVCSCPARGNCWHIKLAEEMDEDAGIKTPRCNDYREGVC